jgi:hypothetical protein
VSISAYKLLRKMSAREMLIFCVSGLLIVLDMVSKAKIHCWSEITEGLKACKCIYCDFCYCKLASLSAICKLRYCQLTSRGMSTINCVGIKRGYGRTDTRTDGRTEKKDKMRMRTKWIKCGTV